MGNWTRNIVSRVFFILILMCSTASAFAAKKVALVIGTDAYQNLPKLQKAVNDAQAIATTLEGIGFTVIKGENLTRRQMNQTLSDLERVIEPGDQVFFFFAGHGVAMGATNYLIPADMPLPAPGDESLVRGEAFAVDRIIERIQSSGASASFIVLDACRNNPFKSSGVRSIGTSRGLANMSASKGVFVLYSAGIGQTALDRLSDDDPNPNSVFTRHLVPLIKTPGLSHVQLAKQMQTNVDNLARTVRHEQQPAYYDQVIGNMYLVEAEQKVASLPKKEKSEVLTPSSNKPVRNDRAELFYNQVKDSKNIDVLRAFTKKFHGSFYATITNAKILELEKEKKKQKTTNVQSTTPFKNRAFVATHATRECDRLAASPYDEYARANGVKTGKLKLNSSEAIASCRNAVAEFSNDPTLQFQLARALYAGNRHQSAIKIYRKSAEQGYASAQSNIGFMYEKGKGASIDYEIGVQWYRKAADQGFGPAQYNLGVMYEHGRGVTKDSNQAAMLIQKSVAQGNKRSIDLIKNNPKFWSKSFRIEFQRLLKEQDYYTGSLDGSLGPATKQAVDKLAASGG